MLAGAQECVPSATASSMAVTVTVCGVVKLAEVKVSVDGAKVHWVLVPIVTVTAEPTEVGAQVEQFDDRSSFVITAEGVDYLESQIPNNEFLMRVFRESESGMMLYPKALINTKDR